jgi:hypothetical protein
MPSSQPHPRKRPVIAAFLLGAVFLGAFWLTRKNANAGIFLFLAVVTLSLALVALIAVTLRGPGGRLIGRAGPSERGLLTIGLLLVSVLTPWAVEVKPVHAPLIFGWSSPAADLFVLAMLLTLVTRRPGFRPVGLGLGAAALLGWALWLSAELTSPPFRSSGFPFIPTDLIGEGWYIALLALAIAVDGLAAHYADDDVPIRPATVWPFSLMPGVGLVRLNYRARGRLWLFFAAFLTFLTHAGAVAPEEFQYYGSLGSLPPAGPRTANAVPVLLLILLWIASGVDTWRKLREERETDPAMVPAARLH